MASPRQGVTGFLLALCAVQLLGVCYYAAYFWDHGFLPAPFVYDKSDSFMDFFHVLYWADHPGRYTDWRSVYPPINFWFMRLVGWLTTDPSKVMTAPYYSVADQRLSPAQYGGGFELRATQVWPFAVIVLMYLLSIGALVGSKLWDMLTAVQRALLFVAIAFSAPVLFAFERGNMIILSLPLLALVFSREGWPRVLGLALLINLKPYFAILMLGLLLKQKYAEFMLTTLAAGSIFLFTGMLLDPYFLSFVGNISGFAGGSVFSGREVLALPSTITAFAYTLRVYAEAGSVATIMGLGLTTIASLITAANILVLLLATGALVAFRNSISTNLALAFLAIMIANSGVWVGGYSMLTYLAIVPTLLTLRWRWLALSLLVGIFLPLDALTIHASYINAQNVFLSGRPLLIEWQLTAGTFLRPMFNLALLACLTGEFVTAAVPIPRLGRLFSRATA